MRPLNIGIDKAVQKIKHYCGYQERSHAETRDKLYSFGLYKNDVEALLSQMIEEDYLNEERFALAFAGGKFRMKNWGRIKIKNELQLKRVSPYSLKKALNSIPEEAYLQTLRKLAGAKNTTLRSEKNIFSRKTKLRNYLMQKGYEPNLVMDVINEMLDKKSR